MNEDALQPPVEAWEMPPADDAMPEAQALRIDIAGFEGPLDLLLALARTQKVDLARISITALVDQYLEFIAESQSIRLEVAADYLVMAAWLAFLKSRLLLPREKSDANGPSGEELAQRLAFRLMRLDAMRRAAAQLLNRSRLGRDVFARGSPEGVRTIRETAYTAQIFDLLKAYATQRSRAIKQVHVVRQRTVWSIKDARRHLERLLGGSAGDWVQLDLFLQHYMPVGAADGGALERTVVASSFGASLELARDGLLDIRQDMPFGPIYMRRRGAGTAWEKVG
jgi:segregation and condensation protein A